MHTQKYVTEFKRCDSKVDVYITADSVLLKSVGLGMKQMGCKLAKITQWFYKILW